MKVFCLSFAIRLVFIAECVRAEKLTLAHVAINPGQGMLLLAKDSGLLAKYGFTADVILIPGTPRTVQALIAGDLDYAVAGTPAVLRARMQGADVAVLASLAAYSSQRVFVRPDSTVNSLRELKGKLIGVTQFGSAGDIASGGAEKDRSERKRSYYFADGRNAGSSPGIGIAQDRGWGPWRLRHVVGVSRNRAPVERGELPRARLQSIGWAAEHHGTQNQSGPQRGVAIRSGLCRDNSLLQDQ
jgi:NMT1/THI5 like